MVLNIQSTVVNTQKSLKLKYISGLLTIFKRPSNLPFFWPRGIKTQLLAVYAVAGASAITGIHAIADINAMACFHEAFAVPSVSAIAGVHAIARFPGLAGISALIGVPTIADVLAITY